MNFNDLLQVFKNPPSGSPPIEPNYDGDGPFWQSYRTASAKPYRLAQTPFSDRDRRAEPIGPPLEPDAPQPTMGLSQAALLEKAEGYLADSPTAAFLFQVNNHQHVETWMGPMTSPILPVDKWVGGQYSAIDRSIVIDSNMCIGQPVDLSSPQALMHTASVLVHEHRHGVQDFQNLLFPTPGGWDVDNTIVMAGHREAAAIATEVQVAWELKERGKASLWQYLASPTQGARALECRDFERACILDPAAAVDGQAMRAAHDRAYLELTPSYGLKDLDRIMRQARQINDVLNDPMTPPNVAASLMRQTGPHERLYPSMMAEFGSLDIRQVDQSAPLPNYLDLPGYPKADDPQYHFRSMPRIQEVKDALRAYQIQVYDQKPRDKALATLEKVYKPFADGHTPIREDRVLGSFFADARLKNPLLGVVEPEPAFKAGLKRWRENKLEGRLKTAREARAHLPSVSPG